LKKPRLVISIVLIILILWGFSFKPKPELKGLYQSETGQNHVVQMLIREEDSSFVEWIDNREVDNGTYKKVDYHYYRFKSNRQKFDIVFKDDNTFEIIITKINNNNPIIMKNITTEDHMQELGKWDDVEDYKKLLD
jgi:hypothetical protein